MKTAQATRLFLNTRRARQGAPKTIEAYEWALSKLTSVFPDELPTTAEEMRKVFTGSPTWRRNQGSLSGDD